MIRSVASRSTAGVSFLPWRSSRSTGAPARIRISLRGKSFGLRAYGASSSLGPHCAHGITGHPVVSPIRAAPVLPTIGHRSGSRVIVPSAYTIDALALLHRGDGGAERLRRVSGLAVDRDLPGAAQDAADDRDREHLRLAEEARQPAVVVDEVRERHRVDLRDVVADEDAAAGLRDVLRAAPVALGQQHQRPPQHERAERERPSLLLLRNSPRHPGSHHADQSPPIEPGSSAGTQFRPPEASMSRRVARSSVMTSPAPDTVVGDRPGQADSTAARAGSRLRTQTHRRELALAFALDTVHGGVGVVGRTPSGGRDERSGRRGVRGARSRGDRRPPGRRPQSRVRPRRPSRGGHRSGQWAGRPRRRTCRR